MRDMEHKREYDRRRYRQHAEELRARQRAYYAAHREECIMRVRLSEYKRLRHETISRENDKADGQ